jgi:NAD(P) transhydrogenase subunit alpha
MNIAVPREDHMGETRVSLIPEHVAKLVKSGADVSIESGLGKTLRIVEYNSAHS